MNPKKVEVLNTFLIITFDDSVKYLDMSMYLKHWESSEAKRLLKHITTDLKKAYLEDGYSISWKGYNFSIDPEEFYNDALDGYPNTKAIATAKLINVLKKMLA
jgi:hypothetical protein